MKTDFTERLRNFLKEEGLKCRLLVSYDDDGNVCKVIANTDHDDDDFLFFTPPISTYREN